MKIIITTVDNHVEVTVRGSEGINLHAFAFNDMAQAQAFMTGWRCAQTVANGLIQGMPHNEERTQGA